MRWRYFLQYSFDRVVEFLYLSWVKDILWLPYRFLNVGLHSSAYFFSGWKNHLIYDKNEFNAFFIIIPLFNKGIF